MDRLELRFRLSEGSIIRTIHGDMDSGPKEFYVNKIRGKKLDIGIIYSLSSNIKIRDAFGAYDIVTYDDVSAIWDDEMEIWDEINGS